MTKEKKIKTENQSASPKTASQGGEIKESAPEAHQPMAEKNQKKIEELETKCQEYLNGWQRAKADYVNFKNDTEKRVKDIIEYATAGMILDLLPVYDHYKLALQHIPADQKSADWIQGIGHIKREFEEFFKKLEIEEIKTVGEKFNPQFHEAVSHEESDQDEDVVIKEVKSGYTIKGQVIQPAKVIIGSSKK